MADTIDLFKPFYRTDEVLAEIRECLETGWTGLGYKTLEFERAWVEYSGLPYAHMTNSATMGLLCAVELLKRSRNWGILSKVITTPLTFASTAAAILHANVRPVFADVDESLCLSPWAVESLITSDPDIRAVIFVGLGGNTGNLPQIIETCRRRNVALIVDAAHMAGTRLNGAQPCPEAEATVFSFHSVKNLPTADAGMVCFRDPELDRQAREWTWLGINKDTFTRTNEPAIATGYRWRYSIPTFIGHKAHGNSVMAAMGLVALRYLDQDNARRREIAALYDAQLERWAIPQARNCDSSRHLYQVRVPKKRDHVMRAMREDGISLGVHYAPVTQFIAYHPHRGGMFCENASRASEELLSLPMHLHLTDADVQRVIASFLRAVG